MSEEQQVTSNKILFWVKQVFSPIVVPIIVAFIVGHFTVKSAIESIAISNERNLKIAIQNNAALAEATEKSNQALLEISKQSNATIAEATEKNTQALLESVALTNENTLKTVRETNEATIQQIKLDHELTTVEKEKEKRDRANQGANAFMGDLFQRIIELEMVMQLHDAMVQENANKQIETYSDLNAITWYSGPQLEAFLFRLEASIKSGTYHMEKIHPVDFGVSEDPSIMAFYKKCEYIKVLLQLLKNDRSKMTIKEQEDYAMHIMDYPLNIRISICSAELIGLALRLRAITFEVRSALNYAIIAYANLANKLDRNTDVFMSLVEDYKIEESISEGDFNIYPPNFIDMIHNVKEGSASEAQ